MPRKTVSAYVTNYNGKNTRNFITLDKIPRQHAVRVSNKFYDGRALLEWVRQSEHSLRVPIVPHTALPMTRNQINMIKERFSRTRLQRPVSAQGRFWNAMASMRSQLARITPHPPLNSFHMTNA
jgi:hypothetical protein